MDTDEIHSLLDSLSDAEREQITIPYLSALYAIYANQKLLVDPFYYFSGPREKELDPAVVSLNERLRTAKPYQKPGIIRGIRNRIRYTQEMASQHRKGYARNIGEANQHKLILGPGNHIQKRW